MLSAAVLQPPTPCAGAIGFEPAPEQILREARKSFGVDFE